MPATVHEYLYRMDVRIAAYLKVLERTVRTFIEQNERRPNEEELMNLRELCKEMVISMNGGVW